MKVSARRLGGDSGCAAEELLGRADEPGISQRGPSRLIFEMAAVGYLDCASARLIAGTGRWLPDGVKPVIVSPSPLARRVLMVSGIGALCDFRC